MPYYYNSVIISRELGLDGRVLSGGKVYSYSYGTTTPKQTFATFDGSVVNANPVILDASGHANIFLDTGAYKFVVKDQYDVQIGVIDGVIGVRLSDAIAEPVSLGSSVVVDTYLDVRALTGTYDTVYVCGRASAGDGGSGWLRLDPLDTYPDDNGVSIVSANGDHYIRDNLIQIDPRWFGVQYDTGVDQTTLFTDACSASIRYNVPVVVEDSITISSNFAVASGVYIKTANTGKFTSASAASMTFSMGSKFDGISLSFVEALQPVFLNNYPVYLSWMGAQTTEMKVAKAIAACSNHVNSVLYVDLSLTISGSLIVPENVTLVQVGTNYFSMTTTGIVNISVPNVVINDTNVFFDINSIQVAADLGERYSYPEWFGAVGDDVTDDSAALKAAMSTGKVQLWAPAYYMATNHNQSTPLIIKGTNGNTIRIDNDVSITNLTLIDMVLDSVPENELTCQSLTLITSTVAATIAITAQGVNAMTSAYSFGKATIGAYEMTMTTDLDTGRKMTKNNDFSGTSKFWGPVALIDQDLDPRKSLTVYGQTNIIKSTYNQLVRCAVETMPRGLIHGDYYVEAVANTKLTYLSPICVPVRSVMEVGDKMKIGIRWSSGTQPSFTCGIVEYVYPNMIVRARTDIVYAIDNTVGVYGFTISDVSTTDELDPAKEYYLYLSIIAGTGNCVVYVSSGGNMLNGGPLTSWQTTEATSLRYNIDSAISGSLGSLLNNPYISYKPGV